MNSEQSKYISGLSYEYTGNPDDLDNIELSARVIAATADVKTAGDLVDAIKAANCFGLKDSLILRLLS